MKSELELRPFRAGDFESVRALCREIWNLDRSEQYDRMRFLETMDGPCVGMVAMDGPACAAFYMIWPMTLVVGTTKVAGGQSIDTMTGRNYQGRGLFTQLARKTYELCADRGMKVLFGLPNRNSLPGFVKRLSWASNIQTLTMVRPLSLANVFPGGDIVSRALPPFPMASSKGFTCTRERPSSKDLEACLASGEISKDVWRVARSPAWYDFRYQPAGTFDYRWSVVWRNGAIEAFAITGIPLARGDRLSRANLAEVFGSTPEAKRTAITLAVREAREARANFMVALLTLKSRARDLMRNGFFHYRSTPLITRGLDASSFDANPYGSASWDLFGGDFDLV